MKGRATTILVGLLFWGVVGLTLWRVFVHDPDDTRTTLPATTVGPAYWRTPTLLLGKCISFPWPEDDADRSQQDLGIWVTDVEVEPCDDRLDWHVAEVNPKADGCDILADLTVTLLGPSYTDPANYVLCVRWYRPDRT